MKIELIAPLQPAHIAPGETAELLVRALDGEGDAAAHIRLVWLVQGSCGGFEQHVTVTDDSGQARNRLFAGVDHGGGCSVVVQTPDGTSHPIGVVHAATAADPAGATGLFVPGEAIVDTPDAAAVARKTSGAGRPAQAGTNGNRLTIHYPSEEIYLPMDKDVPLWLRYCDADGNGIPNKMVNATVTNASFGVVSYVPTRHIGVTDRDGWIVTTIRATQYRSEWKPGSVEVFLDAYVIDDPQAADYKGYTASTDAGGRGAFFFPSLDPKISQWTPVKISYRLASGAPARYRPLAITAPGDSPWDEVAENKFYRGVAETDDEGIAYDFIWVYWSEEETRPGSRVRVAGRFRSPNDFFSASMNGDVGSFSLLIRGPSVYDPQPQSSITLEWLDELKLNTAVRVRATFRKDDGTPVSGAQLAWQVPPDLKGVVRFDRDTTSTLGDGTSLNTLHVSGANSSRSVGVWAESTDPVTGAYVNGVETGFFINAANPPKRLDWQVHVASRSGSQLDLNRPYTFQATVTNVDGALVDLLPVSWSAYPPGRVVLTPRYPTIVNGWDRSSVVDVTGLGTEPMSVAIRARVINPDTQTYSENSVTVQFGKPAESIQITSSDGNALPLYSRHKLTASYQGNEDVTQVVWSAGPEQPAPDHILHPGHTFAFDPNPAPLVDGVATTYLTCTGLNRPVDSVTVYARSVDAGTRALGSTVPPLSFTPAAQGPSAYVGVVSLDGNPLSAGDVHLLRACVWINGVAVEGEPVEWTLDSHTVSLLAASTATRADGTTTNGVLFTGTGSATVTVTARLADGTEGSLTLTFRPQELSNTAGQGTIALSSSSGSRLRLGQEPVLTATYVDSDGTPMTGVPISWDVFPADRVTLYRRLGYTIDAGWTSNGVMETCGSTDFVAYISATSFNGTTGENDGGAMALTFSANKEGIQISSPSGDSLPLFQPSHVLAAVADPTVPALLWSVDPDQDPDYTFVFKPNPTPLSGGSGTTRITAFGPNTTTTVTVYARSMDPANFETPIGQKTLTFTSVAQPPQGALLDVVSLDGTPLSVGDAHLMQATYRLIDGTPVPNAPVLWRVDAAKVSLLTDPGSPITYTDANGIAINGVVSNTAKALDVTVTASASNPAAEGAATVHVQSGSVNLPGSASLTLTAPSSPLSMNVSYPVTVTYLDTAGHPIKDKEILWAAFPPDRLKFDQDFAHTDASGQAVVGVRCTAGPDVDSAILHVSAFNAQSGAYDHQQIRRDFENPVPLARSGLQIDKPYARTNLTGQVKPMDLQQVIQCRVQVPGGNGGGQALELTTTPALNNLTWLKMYKADGTELLPLDTSDPSQYKYMVGADGRGMAAFRVGSSRLADFTLNVNLPGKSDGPSSQLVLALVSGTLTSASLTAPMVPELANNDLPIPKGKPTFKVTIPVSSAGLRDYPAVLLLNDRVVYEGTIGDQLIDGVDVAYALLKPTGNTLVYLAVQRDGTVRESPPPGQGLFTAGPIANAQTGPDTGGLPRSLPAPKVQVSSSTIGPADIADGLSVLIPAALVKDRITLYLYLSGIDALTQAPIRNICALTHAVVEGDPQLSGQGLLMVVPQAYLAGYGQGTLQVDYKLDRGSINWSGLGQTPYGTSTTFTLNTTF